MIVAFTLKSTSDKGSAEHSGTPATANGSTNGNKTDGHVDSSENATEETEKKVSEDVNRGDGDEEIPGEDVKENKENADEKNSSDGGEGKETGDGENPSEVPAAKSGEKEERLSAAAYKDNMDVVMREDLKSVFQKFGTVKVPQ